MHTADEHLENVILRPTFTAQRKWIRIIKSQENRPSSALQFQVRNFRLANLLMITIISGSVT